MIKHILFVFTALFLFNCSKNDDGPTTTPITEQVAYLLYDEATDGYSTYYKGQLTTLNAENREFAAEDIAVDNGILYTGGYQKINGDWDIALWKNGVLDPNTPVYTERCYVTAIAVNNGDVYIAGRRIYPDRIDAAYWLNNTYNALPKTVQTSIANDIHVENNLVSIAGYQSASFGDTLASAWENGSFYYIGSGEINKSIAYCTYNDGTNALYGGYKTVDGKSAPSIWDKNGYIATYNLPDSKSGNISQILKFQEDIYTLIEVTEFDGNTSNKSVELWKNGTFLEEVLPPSTENGNGFFLDVIDGNVCYAANRQSILVFKSLDKTFSLPSAINGKWVFAIAK